MNTIRLGTNVFLLGIVLLSIGCNTSLEPDDAIRAVQQSRKSQSVETPKPARVVWVAAEEVPDTIMHLRIGKMGAPALVEEEFPLRKIAPALVDSIRWAGCPTVSSDGLDSSGNLAGYMNSSVCVDSERSTVEEVLVQVDVAWGTRLPEPHTPPGQLTEVLSVPYAKTSTRSMRGGFTAWISFDGPGMSSNPPLQPPAHKPAGG